jgi:hypothetical protein
VVQQPNPVRQEFPPSAARYLTAKRFRSIRSGGAREPTFRPSIGADLDFAEAMVAVLSQFVLQSQPPAAT